MQMFGIGLEKTGSKKYSYPKMTLGNKIESDGSLAIENRGNNIGKHN
jgi:hypothetical protein